MKNELVALEQQLSDPQATSVPSTAEIAAKESALKMKMVNMFKALTFCSALTLPKQRLIELVDHESLAPEKRFVGYNAR